MNLMERRLAHFIMQGTPFTADDITDHGAITFDTNHEPNGAQSSIGAMFQHHSRRGHIAFTGRVVRSTAKHRKGGSIRVWEATESGRRWAEAVK
jgi:hypothetical protein